MTTTNPLVGAARVFARTLILAILASAAIHLPAALNAYRDQHRTVTLVSALASARVDSPYVARLRTLAATVRASGKPCASESSSAVVPCYWNAKKRGNGLGESFAVLNSGVRGTTRDVIYVYSDRIERDTFIVRPVTRPVVSKSGVAQRYGLPSWPVSKVRAEFGSPYDDSPLVSRKVLGTRNGVESILAQFADGGWKYFEYRDGCSKGKCWQHGVVEAVNIDDRGNVSWHSRGWMRCTWNASDRQNSQACTWGGMRA